MYCVELYAAAAEENKLIDFAGLRIYGLLTNVNRFEFYSYDPVTKQFCFDETILVVNKRPKSMTEMIDGDFSPW
jgi:hypothetical protein